MRAAYLPSVALVLVSMSTLTGCHTSTPLQTTSAPEPETVSSTADSYALGPPPTLILPRDEPLTGTEPVTSAQTPEAQTPDSDSIPPVTGDLWARLRGGLRLSRDRLEIRDAARQLATGRNHLNSTLRRGEPYLWHMVQEVEARGMPIEIALLPAVESAYDPNAYSPSHAVGLWQFLPGTGARFGLRRNWWYDGRRDVTESTRAALDYLSYLHDMFNDWPLALAAYNSGEGRVQQALQSNRERGLPRDFWSISLPTETRNYVPRLLGLAELLASPEQYGYEPSPLSDAPRFESVELPGQVELELAADLIDLDPKILQQLNPGFSRWATDPEGPHRLLVPHGQGERLREAIAALPTASLVRWHQYIAEEGEDLPDIARRYGVQTALLQQVNNISGNRVMSGTELRIPRAFARDVPLPVARVRAIRPASVTYIIRPGDSLWRIARQHDVRVSDLMRWNNLPRSATLQPGRKLVIRGNSKTTDT